MKVSTRGRYGVRAILDLAMHQDQGPVDLKDIARRQGLPYRYLERLFSNLRQAGIVGGVRGSQGGYQLSRRPEKIRMHEVVEALEGPILPAQCTGDPPRCPISRTCVPHDMWARVSGAVYRVLSETTLADLVQQEQKIRAAEHGARARSARGARDHV